MNYAQEIEQIKGKWPCASEEAREVWFFQLLTLANKMQEEIKDSEFLFQLLDDIDTCSDAYRPEQNAYFKNVMVLCQKRFEVLPKSHWIACSERLPEKSGEYLLTITDNEGRFYRQTGYWHSDVKRWNVWGEVIAWIPLPEPFKGEL